MKTLQLLGTVVAVLAASSCQKDVARADMTDLDTAGGAGMGSSAVEAISHGRSGAGGRDSNGHSTAGAGGSAPADGTAGTNGATAGTASSAAGANTATAGASSGSAGASSGSAGAKSGGGGASSGTAGASSGTGGATNGTAGASNGAAGAAGASGSRSAGCGLTGKPTGDLHLKGKDGAGVTRDYEVLVPTTYNPATPLALTFVYHGAGGSSADGKSYGIQNATGAAAGSIFVFPQGVAFQTYGVGWDDRCGGYDMGFFDDMVTTLAATYCIDTSRVYAGGFSWGCDQVTALACCRGDKIRAIAAASCTDEYSDPANYKTYQACPVTNRAAIRFTHDTTGDGGYPAPLFATTVALFRYWNACSTTATAVTPSPCRTFASCRVPVVDCPYDNLGHQIPAGWGADTWKFFTGVTP